MSKISKFCHSKPVVPYFNSCRKRAVIALKICCSVKESDRDERAALLLVSLKRQTLPNLYCPQQGIGEFSKVV